MDDIILFIECRRRCIPLWHIREILHLIQKENNKSARDEAREFLEQVQSNLN